MHPLWILCGKDEMITSHHMGVSENRGTPKSSILIGFSIINHPFWGSLFLETPISLFSNHRKTRLEIRGHGGLGNKNGCTGGFWVQPISAGREYRGQFDDGQGTFEPRSSHLDVCRSFWKAKGIKAVQKLEKKSSPVKPDFIFFTSIGPGKNSGAIECFVERICHVSQDVLRCSICCN